MGIFKKHVKAFQEGFFSNRFWTEEELLSAVEAQRDLKDLTLPDIKLTHEKNKKERDLKYKIFENLPFSLGKMDNFSLENVKNIPTLFLDYINVLDPVQKMINDKLLTTHSVEFYTNVVVKETGKKYKIVITAIGLLPAGELPALFEVFKPYMYSLEKDSSDDENENESEITKLFDYESKEIFYFKNEYNEPKEVIKSMFTKEKYEKMASKFSKMTGKTCMSFSEFEKLDQEKQSAIVSDLIDAISSEEEAEKETASSSQNFSLAFEKEVNKKVSELEKKMFALVEQKVSGDSERVKSLETIIQKFETQEKEKNVFSFLQEHLDPKAPKISPKQGEILTNILMNVSSDNKINFSLNNKTEFSTEDLIKEFVKSLPVQNSKTTKEIFVTTDGLKIDDLIRSEYPEGTSDESIAEDKKVKKFALDNDLDYSDAYEKLILNQ